MPEAEIGEFSGRVLLTGAGFSKNFGGMLASEFDNDLVIHPKVRTNRYLKDLLNRELNFEDALAKAWSQEGATSKRVATLTSGLVRH